MTKQKPTGRCPHCGELINKNAAACPFCGSDEKTGWSDSTYLDNIDIGDDIDYDELVQNEFPENSPPLKKKIPWLGLIGAAVLFCFIFAMLKVLL
jgi:hypothetical protein